MGHELAIDVERAPRHLVPVEPEHVLTRLADHLLAGGVVGQNPLERLAQRH